MLPRDFLTQLARKYDLAPKQAEAFVALFSRNDDNDIEAATSLNISPSAFSSRMTGVYQKFRIAGKGAGKANKLKNWLLQEYAKLNPPQASSTAAAFDLDALVREVRAQVAASIQKRCGTMRVLDMEQPITIDSIYTSVNILEKISRNQRRSIDELLDGCDRENFDRFILGAVKQQRIPGIEAVQKHDKLLILGKPGAGKTTFLKWLALQCQAGKLHEDRVPFFVTLKEFAESEGKPSLIDFLAQQLVEYGIENAKSTVERILLGGRAMILLDGLDEVREVDGDRVLNNIRVRSEQFYKNQFIMTCRIAAKEYTFDKFTEVEVADFDTEKIANFAHKWFHPKDLVKAEEFPKDLETYPGLQELATNPLLLTLLCLVYEERAGFPANRSELYKEGLDVLLKKWDAKRNIKRDEVYKQLSLQRKEDLLSQIACITFERSDYFFKQKFVEGQIQDYIRNLPNASNDPEALQLDSEAVLKSIEAQHGLLVERAREIYSFSHLTFQEYFTARHFKEKSDSNFSDLVCNITEKSWREVFLLTVGMLKNADKLLQAMKQKIDRICSQDEKLQNFLVWVEQKSASVDVSYKQSIVRSIYFDFDNTHRAGFIVNPNNVGAIYRTSDKNLYNALGLEVEVQFESEIELDRNIDCIYSICDRYYSSFDRTDRRLDPENIISRIYSLAKKPELQQSILKIRKKLPYGFPKNDDDISISQWWAINKEELAKQLREIKIEHRNIGHDWQFSEEQIILLQQYYDANKLLVDCLNSDCYVSREVRESIESTLLLPIESIDKYTTK